MNNTYWIYGIILAAFFLILFLLSQKRRRVGNRIAVPQAAEFARSSIRSMKEILVPTTGTPHSERAVELACRIGEDQRATIHLVYVIVLPRALPLGSPMPDDESKAQEALQRAESIVRSHGLTCKTWVERARGSGEGIIHRVKELQPDVIVTGMRPTYGSETSLLGRTTDTLLREAPCEVIVSKMPE